MLIGFLSVASVYTADGRRVEDRGESGGDAKIDEEGFEFFDLQRRGHYE
jgi:hypothetical protein